MFLSRNDRIGYREDGGVGRRDWWVLQLPPPKEGLRGSFKLPIKWSWALRPNTPLPEPLGLITSASEPCGSNKTNHSLLQDSVLRALSSTAPNSLINNFSRWILFYHIFTDGAREIIQDLIGVGETHLALQVGYHYLISCTDMFTQALPGVISEHNQL